jgi:hypothetical protein
LLHLLLLLVRLLLLLQELGVIPLTLDRRNLVSVLLGLTLGHVPRVGQNGHTLNFGDCEGSFFDCSGGSARGAGGGSGSGGVLGNVEEMGDDVHVLRYLGKNDHRLDLVVDFVVIFLETHEMRVDLRKGRSRMVLLRDVGVEEGVKLRIDRGDGGFRVCFPKILPDIACRDSRRIAVGDGWFHPQKEVAHGLVIGLIPFLGGLDVIIIGAVVAVCADGDPKSFGTKVGLHLRRPGEVVGAGEFGDGDAVVGGRHGFIDLGIRRQYRSMGNKEGWRASASRFMALRAQDPGDIVTPWISVHVTYVPA